MSFYYEIWTPQISHPTPPHLSSPYLHPTASTSNDDTVRLWDAGTWECLSTLYGHTETVWTICEVDRWLISGSGDGTLRVWDPDTGECEAVVQANEQPVSTLLAVDGGGLGNDKGLVSGSWDSSIAFWGLVEADRADQ